MNYFKRKYMLWFKKFDEKDPLNFRFKVVECGFSGDYVQFQYSTNKGLTWNYIHTFKEDGYGSSRRYYLGKLTYPLNDGDFKSTREEFSSYKKIMDWENIQKEKVKFYNKQIADELKKKEYKRKEALKRANRDDSIKGIRKEKLNKIKS